jgi:hypothetical protein
MGERDRITMHHAWVIVIAGILGFILAQGFGKMSYAVILPFMEDGLCLSYTPGEFSS